MVVRESGGGGGGGGEYEGDEAGIPDLEVIGIARVAVEGIGGVIGGSGGGGGEIEEGFARTGRGSGDQDGEEEEREKC